MAVENVMDILSMGRHGVYVWSVYGFSGIALMFITSATLIQHRNVRAKLHKRFLRETTI